MLKARRVSLADDKPLASALPSTYKVDAYIVYSRVSAPP